MNKVRNGIMRKIKVQKMKRHGLMDFVRREREKIMSERVKETASGENPTAIGTAKGTHSQMNF